VTEPPVDAPPERAEEHPAEPELRCWRCHAPHDRYQEYCLECGARLVPLPGAGAWRSTMWSRESPFWFWATFLGLLLIALAAGAIVLAATRDDEEPQGQGTGPGPTTSQLTVPPTTAPPPITTSTLPPEITIPPTTNTATIPTLPTTTTQPTTTSGQTTTGGGNNNEAILSWPSGREGYTIILTSVPESRGRSAAEAQARQAQDRGVDDVGVLDSSNYSSLTTGFWVVFSGIYDTESQAAADLPSVRQSGYPTAYLREITP
jgi:hypothetical protein